MRRARALALSLLILAGGVTLWRLATHDPRAHGSGRVPVSAPPAVPASSGSSTTAAPRVSEHGARSAATSHSFNARLRCAQDRLFYKRLLPPEELALLCARRPLEVLRIEAPLAQAGDLRALAALALIANSGRCDGPSREATAGHRERMLALAQKRGAAPQTLQRLDALLAEEEQGPTAEELEACRQGAALLRKLQPGMTQQFADMLGRPVEELRGEDQLDAEIEFGRKMLVHGDAEAEESLAMLLLEKHTPQSQAEALTLLEQAADSSPSAKTALARCLLQGCPTPAADHGAAHQLLVEAARSGDLFALTTLAGATGADAYPDLPAPERYAWSEFLQRLHEEGCFGAADYATWALGTAQPDQLGAMSPADAATAQGRAAELLGTPLQDTRAQLGCD